MIYILVELSLVYSSTYLVTHEAMDTSITSFHHGGMRPSVFWELHSIAQFLTDIYHHTVHLDNIKIPFYQQMHLLLNI